MKNILKPQPEILFNGAQCLECGDIVVSRWIHNFESCSCGNVCVDGGHSYFKRIVIDRTKYLSLSLTTDDDHCILREWCERGGRGKDGTEPLTWIKLKDINNEYLDNLIKYCEDRQQKDKWYNLYLNEKHWREHNDRTV